MPSFDIAELLARAGKLDRLAGDCLGGQRRAAACIAVHLCHQDTGDAERLVERLRDIDRVLTGHRIDNQHDFGRLDLRLDVL